MHSCWEVMFKFPLMLQVQSLRGQGGMPNMEHIYCVPLLNVQQIVLGYKVQYSRLKPILPISTRLSRCHVNVSAVCVRVRSIVHFAFELRFSTVLKLYFTARQRILREGNVFSRVCL